MIGHGLPVYQGYASQYGRGLGNVLGGLVRAALPFVSKMAKTAAPKVLEHGLNLLSKHVQKRTVSRPRKGLKRKAPPGKPAKKAKKPRKTQDIFTT